MYYKIKIFFSNPIIAFLLPTVIAFSLFFYAKKTVEMSYSISKPEIIAKKYSDMPSLKFYWNSKQVNENLYKQKIVLWNSGNTHIDFNDISKTKPLILSIKELNRVVDVFITKKARDNLRVLTEKDTENKKYNFKYLLNDDDAFEIYEGFETTIFYVGDEKLTINIDGRVKGSSSDKLINIEWSKIKSSIDDKFIVFIILIILLITGITLILASLKNSFFDFFSSFLGVIYVSVTIGILFGLYKPYIYGLYWF